MCDFHGRKAKYSPEQNSLNILTVFLERRRTTILTRPHIGDVSPLFPLHPKLQSVMLNSNRGQWAYLCGKVDGEDTVGGWIKLAEDALCH